jgi:hypothetical protein
MLDPACHSEEAKPRKNLGFKFAQALPGFPYQGEDTGGVGFDRITE